MAYFEKTIPIIFEIEGGFVDHPSDPGGTTNYGITLKTLQRAQRELKYRDFDYDKDGEITWKDVKALTLPDAAYIYEKFWWDVLLLGEVFDQKVATKIMDLAVHRGIQKGTRMAQEAVNELSPKKIDVDDIMGRMTIYAINKCDPKLLLSTLKRNQLNFYKSQVNKKPELGIFLKGWKRRVDLC